LHSCSKTLPFQCLTFVYELLVSCIFFVKIFQTYKLVKAWNLLECGRLGEALRYCEAVADKVLGDYSKFCTEVVKQLVEVSPASLPKRCLFG